MTDTLLVIAGFGLPPYSARGISQTLTLTGGQMKRTVNGEMRDISLAAFRKYESSVSCKDQTVPAIDGVYLGKQVTVDCACELSYLTSGGSPSRTVVSGTMRTDGSYTFYRPRLVMRVSSIETTFDEWQADLAWKLGLTEV